MQHLERDGRLPGRSSHHILGKTKLVTQVRDKVE